MFGASTPDAMNMFTPLTKEVVNQHFNYLAMNLANIAVRRVLKLPFLVVLLLFFSFKSKAQIIGDSVVCANSSMIYSYPYTTGYSYIWNSFGSAQSTANNNSLTVTWGSAGYGQITLIVKNALGVTTYSAAMNVTINPLPVPRIIPMNTSGCNIPPPISVIDGTVVAVDSLKGTCYEVCDSSLYYYKAAYPSANHSYVWSVIPASPVDDLSCYRL